MKGIRKKNEVLGFKVLIEENFSRYCDKMIFDFIWIQKINIFSLKILELLGLDARFVPT